jgi:hypothetical protein
VLVVGSTSRPRTLTSLSMIFSILYAISADSAATGQLHSDAVGHLRSGRFLSKADLP